MREIERATFERHRKDIEKTYPEDHGVLVRGRPVEVYATFEEAAQLAVARYGKGPYMIRQIQQAPIVLPSSIMLYDQALAQNR
ncbi:MAG: hypothetical protein F4Y71_07020 [Acidobacteria bacterium]|nr:hypothetical protein [Acidobacteriota bacterium]MYG74197.1 hypothetical protein [Acidobacteriota bacterium]